MIQLSQKPFSPSLESGKRSARQTSPEDERAIWRILTALMASIVVYFLILPAFLVGTLCYMSYGWSIYRSSLSPDWSQRARIVFQGAGFLDDPEVRLSISGGPADGTYICLVDEDASIQRVSASFAIRWVSNHELHIADQRGDVKDWAVIRIVPEGVLVDQRTME